MLLFFSLSLAACGTPTLEVKDYSKACTVEADCVAVYIGPLCQTCGGCPNEAISQSSKAKYDADAAAAARSCPPNLNRAVCAACRLPEVACTAGACALRPLP